MRYHRHVHGKHLDVTLPSRLFTDRFGGVTRGVYAVWFREVYALDATRSLSSDCMCMVGELWRGGYVGESYAVCIRNTAMSPWSLCMDISSKVYYCGYIV